MDPNNLAGALTMCLGAFSKRDSPLEVKTRGRLTMSCKVAPFFD